MFTQEEYLTAWAVYGGGVIVFMLAWWMLTANIKWRGLRHSSRLIMLVLVALPWPTQQGSEYLSPAWLASGIEGAFEGPGAFWRAGEPLVIALSATLGVCVVLYTFLWWRARGEQPRVEPSVGENAA